MNTACGLTELCAGFGECRVAVACGVFDGVHRGHQAIIAALLQLAGRLSARPVVVTFEPHPRTVLQPGKAPRLLTVKEQKRRLLRELGVHDTVILPFSRHMASLEPEEFVVRHLCPPGVELRGICVGAQWRFGALGRGDTALLQRFGLRQGFEVISVPPFCLDDRPVSSTRIRQEICAGQLDNAAQLLGRPYSIYGRIVRGQGLGGDVLYCPTANVADRTIILPPSGVYAVRAYLQQERVDARPGIAYVGTAPTVRRDSSDGTPPTPIVELHVFDFHDSLYGQSVEVEFSDFIRPDRKFDSMAELREQIAKDIQRVRDRQGG